MPTISVKLVVLVVLVAAHQRHRTIHQNHYQTIYEHPIFSPKTLNAQKNISQIQGYENSYYVGSYLGYGFHEDGIQSAIKVCKRLNIDLKEFKNADTSRVQWN